MWTQWVNGILGLWVLISPFLGFTAGGLMTNLVVSGIIIALLGFAGAMQEQAEKTRGSEHEHRHA